jgi:hypothetical protein
MIGYHGLITTYERFPVRKQRANPAHSIFLISFFFIKFSGQFQISDQKNVSVVFENVAVGNHIDRASFFNFLKTQRQI